MSYDSLEEIKNKQKQLQVQGSQVPEVEYEGLGLNEGTVPISEDYQANVSKQSNKQSSFNTSLNAGKSNTVSSASLNKDAISQVNPSDYGNIIQKRGLIDASTDSILAEIGKMRENRLNTLKKNLQTSADRERRKLKFNAWANLLTSLGNIAGLGNATPVQTDNTRTLESFKRLQDIYDAADNIESDPTVSWLDRENLNRRAVIDSYNQQSEQNFINQMNQFASGLANAVGVNREQETTNEAASISQGGGQSYGAAINEGLKTSGLTEEGIAIQEGKNRTGQNAHTVNLGGGVGAKKLVGITDRDANTILADLQANIDSGKSSLVTYKDSTGNTVGADIKPLIDGLKGRTVQVRRHKVDEKGNKLYDNDGKPVIVTENVKLSTDSSIRNILMMALGDTGDSQFIARQLTSMIDNADRYGVYYQYFGTDGYRPPIDNTAPAADNTAVTEQENVVYDGATVMNMTQEEVRALSNEDLMKIYDDPALSDYIDDFQAKLSEEQIKYIRETLASREKDLEDLDFQGV